MVEEEVPATIYIPAPVNHKIGRVHPKPLRILFSDTKGIQWADTDATLPNG